MLAVAIAITVIWMASPGRSRHTDSPRFHPTEAAGRPGNAGRPTTVATTIPPTTTTTSTDPGSLPQTMVLPPSSTPQFEAEMAALWQAVVTDSVAGAKAAFFPETAYVQLKAVADPEGDYTDRLVAGFDADIAAAHGLLGADAATATLVGVIVADQYGHWVPPGVCDNRIGYYEVANSRLVYRQDGQVRSFGIASLISWRGQWYVVHLGAILRPTPGGTVEDPENGVGTVPDSTTC
ncbi:MAG: hypothetical protein JO368_12320 [Acidimicrobiales bacterium]|nr:hypothetical protein [Acidimicrobiales bacterium]